MFWLLPGVLWDCKAVVPVELLSKLLTLWPFSAASMCHILPNTRCCEAGKANCFTSNHRAKKTSYLLSFIWVMVLSTLRHVRLSSYCAGNYTDNILKCLQKQSMFFPVRDRSVFLWLYFRFTRPLEAHKTLLHFFHDDTLIPPGNWNKRSDLEFVTGEPRLQGSNAQPARHLLQCQAFDCGAWLQVSLIATGNCPQQRCSGSAVVLCVTSETEWMTTCSGSGC